jgi:hypothetical protein
MYGGSTNNPVGGGTNSKWIHSIPIEATLCGGGGPRGHSRGCVPTGEVLPNGAVGSKVCRSIKGILPNLCRARSEDIID